MLKWIESIRISSSALVSSRSDHGTVAATAAGRVSSATVERPAATKSNSADSVRFASLCFQGSFLQSVKSECKDFTLPSPSVLLLKALFRNARIYIAYYAPNVWTSRDRA